MPPKVLTWRKGITGESGPQKKQEAPTIGAINTPQNDREGEVEEGALFWGTWVAQSLSV